MLPVQRQRGVTLIELVLAITIVSIAAVAILGLLSYVARGSADAMIRNQCVAIASSYLEEISLKSFNDPDGIGGESSRTLFDDVSDYNGLADIGAHDQFTIPSPPSPPIVGLEKYNIAVTVSAGTLGSLSGAATVKRIDVTVTHPSGVTVNLSGYRTNYDAP